MAGISGADAAWSDWPSRYLVEPGLWVQPFGAPHFAPGMGALFLDRDGVVIEDTGYPSDTATIVLRDPVVSVIREANEAGVPVVIVTNQSGVARGYFTWADFAAVTAHIAAELAARSAHADLLIACGYLAGGKPPLDVADHPARKPGPGMLLRAGELLGLDLRRSVMVGDKPSDMEAARRAGLPAGWLVTDGTFEQRADDGFEIHPWTTSIALGLDDLLAPVR